MVSADLPNGVYELRGVAYAADGATGYSRAITVRVKNG